MIDVVDELVQRVDALPQPALDPVPLLGADDAGNEVEREEPLGAGGVAVDVEGDAHLHEHALGRLLAALQLALAQAADGVEQKLCFGPRPAVGVEHLIVEAAGVVTVQPHCRPLRLSRS